MSPSRVLVLDITGTARASVIDVVEHLGATAHVTSDPTELASHLDSPSGWDALVAVMPDERDATLRALTVVHEALPALPIVLALDGARPLPSDLLGSTEELRLLVQSGASDLVVDLSDDAQLSNALERAVSLTTNAREWATRVTSGTSPTLAHLHVVSSTGGGCGRTFVATNLAALLAEGGRSVCLVDLDVPLGGVALALHIRPRFTIEDALKSSGDELPEHIRLLCEESAAGFSVLAAPSDEAYHTIPVKDVQRLIHAARGAFDHVVVDAPVIPSPITLAVIDPAASVWCVETPDLRNVRSLKLLLDAMHRSGSDTSNLHLVLNKYSDGLGITADDIAEIVGRRPAAVIPIDRAVAQSLNEGATLATASPRHPAAVALRDATAAVVGHSPLATPAPTRGDAAASLGVLRWLACAGAVALFGAKVLGWI